MKGRGDVMDVVIKGALTGMAVGGLTSAVVAINQTVVQTLWRFNCLAADITWGMVKVAVEWITPPDDEPN